MDCGNASRGIHSGTFLKVVNACTHNEQLIAVCRRVGGFGVNFVVTWTFKKISSDVVRNENVALKNIVTLLYRRGIFSCFVISLI